MPLFAVTDREERGKVLGGKPWSGKPWSLVFVLHLWHGTLRGRSQRRPYQLRRAVEIISKVKFLVVAAGSEAQTELRAAGVFPARAQTRCQMVCPRSKKSHPPASVRWSAPTLGFVPCLGGEPKVAIDQFVHRVCREYES